MRYANGRPKVGNAGKHGEWNDEFIMFYAFVDLEKVFDRKPWEVVKWALQKMMVEK